MEMFGGALSGAGEGAQKSLEQQAEQQRIQQQIEAQRDIQELRGQQAIDQLIQKAKLGGFRRGGGGGGRGAGKPSNKLKMAKELTQLKINRGLIDENDPVAINADVQKNFEDQFRQSSNPLDILLQNQSFGTGTNAVPMQDGQGTLQQPLPTDGQIIDLDADGKIIKKPQ